VIIFLSVAVSITLTLTGCMSDASAGRGGTPPAASSPPAAAPSATSSPAPVDGPPPSSVPALAAAEPVTYIFPDGRLSFVHPAGWRVDHAGGAATPSPVNWTVYGDGGNERVRIFYSEVGGAVAGPHTRTVFYSEPVPGLQAHSGPAAAHASFFVDHIYGEPHYRMALMSGPAVSPDGGEAADVVIVGGNRVLAASVVFTGGPFPSDGAAKAWFAGEEGHALKNLLMSFSYR